MVFAVSWTERACLRADVRGNGDDGVLRAVFSGSAS